ncbi:MAG TPA: hypothetical protein VFZ53_28060 [Polyangiaceae bacterium]
MELPRVPRDTSDAVERRVLEGLRSMGPAQRLVRAFGLCGATTELAIAGIRLRESTLTETEVRVRLARLRYDSDLVARVEQYRTRRPR